MQTKKTIMPKMLFIEAFQELINIKLNDKFLDRKIDAGIMKEILAEIREAVFEIFFKMQLSLTDTSKKYVAQELFKCMELNNNQEFLKSVFINEIKLKDIPTSDLRILCDLLVYSELEEGLKEELEKRRN